MAQFDIRYFLAIASSGAEPQFRRSEGSPLSVNYGRSLGPLVKTRPSGDARNYQQIGSSTL
jgi:hypothetical protein